MEAVFKNRFGGRFCETPIDLYSRDRPYLAPPVNHTLGGARDRLVMFRQKFGQNRKVLHWIGRHFRVRLNVDNVGGRMFGKIVLEIFPRAWNDSIARVNTRKQPSENEASKRKRCDVATGRTPASLQIHFGSLTPHENSIVRARMRGQILSRFRRGPSRSQPRPVYD